MSQRREPPKLWRPKPKSKSPKALVVEADYFALTSRVDPNVVFWNVGYAHEYSIIPDDITHVWISPRTRYAIRTNLEVQVMKRSLEIWRCNSLQLRENLLPIWGEEGNRSMIYPAVDQGPDELAIRDEKKKVFSERQKRERLELLREAGARYAAKKARAERETEARIEAVLSMQPALDRKIFQAYRRHVDKNGSRIAAIAEEFGFPQVNIERIIRRIESVLPQG